MHDRNLKSWSIVVGTLFAIGHSGCAGTANATLHTAPVPPLAQSSGGAQTSATQVSAGGAREPSPQTSDPTRDRTITTRERCVLAGNCDYELARLEPATTPEALHRRAELSGQLCDAAIVRYCALATHATLEDPTVPINAAVARRRANTACITTHALADCGLVAAVPALAAEQRRVRGLPPDPAADGAGDTNITVAASPGGGVSVASVTTTPTAAPLVHPYDPAQLSSDCLDAMAQCEAGNSQQCVSAATCFVNGRGAPLDQVRAAELYHRACLRGAAEGCTEHGIMLLQGEGIAQDAAGARQAYELGCQGGDLRGCSEAGLMAINGEGGPPDVTRGLAQLDRACGGGHTHACFILGWTLRRSAQTIADRQRAEGLIEQACRRGDAIACTVARRP